MEFVKVFTRSLHLLSLRFPGRAKMSRNTSIIDGWYARKAGVDAVKIPSVQSGCIITEDYAKPRHS